MQFKHVQLGVCVKLCKNELVTSPSVLIRLCFLTALTHMCSGRVTFLSFLLCSPFPGCVGFLKACSVKPASVHAPIFHLAAGKVKIYFLTIQAVCRKVFFFR